MPGPQLGSLTLGTDAMPAGSATPAPGSDWFYTFTSGDMMGQLEFVIYAGLPTDDMTDDRLLISVTKPGNGVWPIGQAINFVTDPNATTYAASALAYGNAAGSGQSTTIENLYFAKDGAITLTEVDETPGTGLTKGSVGLTNFVEIDDNGAVVPTGCQPVLTKLAFVVKQFSTAMNATGKAQGLVEATGAKRAEMLQMLDKLHAIQAAQRAAN